MIYIKDPGAIEAESFKIIDGLVPEAEKARFSRLEWEVVRRAIHAAGDPAFYKYMAFSDDAVKKGVEALLSGCRVFVDTNMLLAGVSTGRLERLGVKANCYIKDDRAIDLARQSRTTRSAGAVEMALKGLESGDARYIFAIGNAPTALFRLLEMVEGGSPSPSLIIGTPVGFVGAKESKEALAASGLSYITCAGTRGGSTVAASILNQLAEIALRSKYARQKGDKNK